MDWKEGKSRYGNVVPNGYYAKEYVKPVQIRCWRFPNGTIRIEEIQTRNGDFDYDETLKWLDSLCGMSPVGVCKEIDYVTEVGLFFKSIILYIINLNEKLKTVFGSNIEINLPAIGNIKMLDTAK